jgi:hypothetical protein
VPEEQDIDADHDGYQRERVRHDGRLSSHRSVLLLSAARSRQGVSLACARPVRTTRGLRQSDQQHVRIEL